VQEFTTGMNSSILKWKQRGLCLSLFFTSSPSILPCTSFRRFIFLSAFLILFLVSSLAYFPYFKKQSRLMRSRCCLCVCVSVYTPIVARQRLGKNSLIVARQRLGKNSLIIVKQRSGKKSPYQCCATDWSKRYRGNEYTRSNKIIVGRVVFNVARVVSRKVGD
jgi:hypothetical protein